MYRIGGLGVEAGRSGHGLQGFVVLDLLLLEAHPLREFPLCQTGCDPSPNERSGKLPRESREMTACFPDSRDS